ncbi:MAG: hypothetical protein KDA32_07180 [Phycisphaerales bacterium]|nr:hypothetical protein [Phycisphaerales bacterium]
MEEVLRQAFSLGVSGLLFVMWWHERRERAEAQAGERGAASHAAQMSETTARVLSVIQANTESMTALREELRSQWRLDLEYRERIARQLERFSDDAHSAEKE